MRLSNYTIDRQWTLNQINDALAAIDPLYKLKEEQWERAKEIERATHEGFREIHATRCKLLSRKAELYEDLYDGLGR